MSTNPPSRPAPLRAADGDDTFTFDSVHRRLPLILHSVIDTNDFPTEVMLALEALGVEIKQGATLKALDDPEWNTYVEEHKGETWFTAPWFFIENYFYKRMLQITAPHVADPFQQQKNEALEAASSMAAQLAATEGAQSLEALVMGSLWGNKADLSLTAGKITSTSGGLADKLLVNDCSGLVELLQASSKLVVVLDNCGLEVLGDLLLVDGLLQSTGVQCISLHVKDSPVFVSDVMVKDFQDTLTWLQANGASALSSRLQAACDAGKLEVVSHPFYTSPLPFWRLPQSLREQLEGSDLVLCKGDANYRRLLGDLHWPHDTPFSEVLQYMQCPVACLRTCKSEVLVGVEASVEARAAQESETWLTSGEYGMVQLSTNAAN